MKNKLRNSKRIIRLYLCTLLYLLLLSGCSQSETITETNYMQITAKEAKNIMDNETDYIILDVRTEEEFSEGHIDGSWGLLMVYACYKFREQKIVKLALLVIFNLLMGYTQIYAGLAVIPIAFHNRELGPKMKWFFYAFYPAHLMILFLISMIMYR